MKDLIRRQLDQHINQLRSLDTYDRPSRGWIRSIREALGLTRSQLSQRLRVTPQNIENLEKAEEERNITLKSLEKVSEAMNCRLYYVLIPENSLENTVNQQILKKAQQIIGYVSHSMALEDQKTKDAELKRQISNLVDELKRKNNISVIWDENK